MNSPFRASEIAWRKCPSLDLIGLASIAFSPPCGQLLFFPPFSFPDSWCGGGGGFFFFFFPSGLYSGKDEVSMDIPRAPCN